MHDVYGSPSLSDVTGPRPPPGLGPSFPSSESVLGICDRRISQPKSKSIDEASSCLLQPKKIEKQGNLLC